MDTQELIKKVRKVEIRTRGISRHLFTGDYHSVFKGKGMAFSEVREYQYGDDIRNIDWNVTARMNHPYVKIFEEERELTVILLIDTSGSGFFGTKNQFKKDLITELSAVLSFSAIENNDKIGVIFFSGKIEKYIAPKKGRSHVLRIIRELIEFKSENQSTNINEALKYLTNVVKKRSIVFIMSDFFDSNYEDALKIASRKHDTIAVNIYDERETEIPNVGLMLVKDAETGKNMFIDTANSGLRNLYKSNWEKNQKEMQDILRRNSVDLIRIRTDESYIEPMRNFFKKREKRY